jgi:hypothetical protein
MVINIYKIKEGETEELDIINRLTSRYVPEK